MGKWLLAHDLEFGGQLGVGTSSCGAVVRPDASGRPFQLRRRLRTSGNAFDRNSEFDYV
jgi:hypothetical protein